VKRVDSMKTLMWIPSFLILFTNLIYATDNKPVQIKLDTLNDQLSIKLDNRALQLDYNFSHDVVFESAYGLQKVNKLHQALQVYQKLLKLNISKNLKIKTLINLSTLYIDLDQLKNALKMNQKALNIHNKRYKNTSILYEDKAHLFMILTQEGIIYHLQKLYKKALESYYKSLILAKKLLKDKPKHYQNQIALIRYKIGLIYTHQKNNQKALESYQKSLDIYKKLAKDTPKIYNKQVRKVLKKLALLYSKQNQYSKALEMYQKRLKFY